MSRRRSFAASSAVLWGAVAISLSWTNPSTNKDGTPCHDLSLIRFTAKQEATGATYTVDYPLWAIQWTDTLWRSREGLPDSCKFTLPQSASAYSWWWITCRAVDFSGNVSDSSNTVSVTAPTPSEVSPPP